MSDAPILLIKQHEATLLLERLLQGLLQTQSLHVGGALSESPEHNVDLSLLESSPTEDKIGIAVTAAFASKCYPNDGWADIGHVALQRLSTSFQASLPPKIGLYNGICGLAMATSLLSEGGTRYARMLAQIDQILLPTTESIVKYVRERPKALPTESFDCISGLCGIGAYLLLRSEEHQVQRILQSMVDVVVSLTQSDAGLAAWYSPYRFVAQNYGIHEQDFSQGMLYVGLAHGVAGLLAFLALTALHGFDSPRLSQAMERMAEWLIAHQLTDDWGINWPMAVSPEWTVQKGFTNQLITRAAWCHGNPGIARALWLAGTVLKQKEYQDVAISAMESVYRRPEHIRKIDTPGLCHGVGGLLHITARFAQDTGRPIFYAEMNHLLERLIAQAHSLTSAVYFVADTSFRTGVGGIILVLLALLYPSEPVWDRMLLLA